jgi:hypothetical protein
MNARREKFMILSVVWMIEHRRNKHYSTGAVNGG